MYRHDCGLASDYGIYSRDKINIVQIMVALLEILFFFLVIVTQHKRFRQSKFINFDK